MITDQQIEIEDPVISHPSNNVPDETEIRLAKAWSWMKDQAASARQKQPLIFSYVLSECDEDIRSPIPSTDICKRPCRNQLPTTPAPCLLAESR